MKRMFQLLALSLALLGAAAQAKTLYVNGSTGSDSVSYAANSASQPWRTVGRAVWGSTNYNSQNASEAAKAGDTVIVAPGVYDTNASNGTRYIPLYNPANSGSSGAPITIKAQTPGSVELRASQSSRGQPIIGTYSRNWVVWDGFLIDERYVVTTADTGPVVVWESNNVTVQNLTIRGYGRGWADNHNGIRIERVNNVTLRGNRISGYNDGPAGMNGSGITMYYTQAATIENNDIYDSNTGIFVKGVISGPIVIRKNLVHNVMHGILFGGIGTTTASNGAQAYNNIVYNCYACIAFIGYDNVSPANVVVANNTVLDANANRSSDGGAILFRGNYSGYRNIRVVNNIFAQSRAGAVAWENQISQVTMSNNVYHGNNVTGELAYRGYATLQQWASASGKDTSGSMQVDPQFVNLSGMDLKLRSGSPLIGAGIDVLDLNGNGSTTDRFNIGAYALGNEVIGPAGASSEAPAPAVRPNPPVLQSVE
jgi:nitrous oxidase accessory protein NosD